MCLLGDTGGGGGFWGDLCGIGGGSLIGTGGGSEPLSLWARLRREVRFCWWVGLAVEVEVMEGFGLDFGEGSRDFLSNVLRNI